MAGGLIENSIKKRGFIVNKNNDYVAFLDLIANCIQDIYKGEVIAETCTSMKNNGVQVTGIVLRKIGEKIAPNFYIEHQFEEWKQGTKDLNDIVNNLCQIFESELETNQHLAQSICFEWETMKNNVFLRLINRDKNKELLEKVPYMEFMDLAIVYFYAITISDGVQGTLVLTKEHQELFGITSEELHRVAEKNTRQQYPVKVYQMKDLVANVRKTLEIEVVEPVVEENFMYVLSNQTGLFGAISMFFQEELKKLSERVGHNLYILPSSIHEVIAVPDYNVVLPEKFLEIVNSINIAQVQETEILSDSVYYYDKVVERLKRIG